MCRIPGARISRHRHAPCLGQQPRVASMSRGWRVLEDTLGQQMAANGLNGIIRLMMESCMTSSSKAHQKRRNYGNIEI